MSSSNIYIYIYNILYFEVYTSKYTRGASPRRADARLGSAHARNYRGVGKLRPSTRRTHSMYCQGVHYLKIAFEWKESEHWDQIQWTSNKFGHPAHDDEQQQEAAALLLQQLQLYCNKEQQQQQSSGSSTLYPYKTDFSSYDDSSITIVHIFTLVTQCMAVSIRDLNHTDPQLAGTETYPTLFLEKAHRPRIICAYLYE